MRFDEVNLDENVLQGIEAMNFQEMTPVQEQTIPVILEGKDIIGCAQTGTGKTAAYTLPLLSRLVAEGNPDNHIRPTNGNAGRKRHPDTLHDPGNAPKAGSVHGTQWRALKGHRTR